MQAINDNKGTPIAKGLKSLLTIAIVLMVLAIILFLVFGFVLSFDNKFSQDILAGLEKSNDVGANNAPLVFFGGALIASIWLYVLNILRKII